MPGSQPFRAPLAGPQARREIFGVADEPVLAEQRAQAELVIDRTEAVIGDHDEGRARPGGVGLQLREQAAD